MISSAYTNIRKAGSTETVLLYEAWMTSEVGALMKSYLLANAAEVGH